MQSSRQSFAVLNDATQKKHIILFWLQKFSKAKQCIQLYFAHKENAVIDLKYKENDLWFLASKIFQSVEYVS